MIRRPPRSTRTDTLFPYTTLFRSLKEGRVPEDWKAMPAKLRHKDRDARWTVKFTKAKERPDGTKPPVDIAIRRSARSEEHTSELQSLMRISYAVFCLKKKKIKHKDI